MCNVRVGADAPTDFKWQKDTWHYLVVTWTPSRMALYADGKKLSQRTFDMPMNCPMPEGPILIGNTSSDGQPAQALIDEVRILDFPLPEAEACTVPTMELSGSVQGVGITSCGSTASSVWGWNRS